MNRRAFIVGAGAAVIAPPIEGVVEGPFLPDPDVAAMMELVRSHIAKMLTREIGRPTGIPVFMPVVPINYTRITLEIGMLAGDRIANEE